jgi:hypothetical protein
MSVFDFFLKKNKKKSQCDIQYHFHTLERDNQNHIQTNYSIKTIHLYVIKTYLRKFRLIFSIFLIKGLNMEINNFGMNESAYSIYQTLQGGVNVRNSVVDANSDEVYQALKSEMTDPNKYRIHKNSINERYENSNGYFYDGYQAGKKVEELSDEIFDEMKKDGLSTKAIDRAFETGSKLFNENNYDISSPLSTNFEGSSFLTKNPNENGQMEHIPSNWLDNDIYKNFESDDTILNEDGSKFYDKSSGFAMTMMYGMLSNATEEEMNSKEFQKEAQNFGKSMYDFAMHIIQHPNTETMLSDKEFYNSTFNPTMEDVKEHSDSISFNVAENFDSTEEILDFIEEKKEYYNTHQDQHSEIRLEYLNRMEDKLRKIDVFSMTQENKPSMKIFYDGKVENDRIVGTLYG